MNAIPEHAFARLGGQRKGIGRVTGIHVADYAEHGVKGGREFLKVPRSL